MNITQVSPISENNTVRSTRYCERKKPLVLIAQDDEKDGVKLRESLKLHDLEVLAVETGEAAVNYAVTHQPDLIIMDNYLSGLSSFDAMRLIRSINSLSIVPILFLSDCSEENQSEQAVLAGCDDYLVRPLDSAKLGNLLGKFLFLKGV
jgi:DNA-binding response OmpR family regulator